MPCQLWCSRLGLEMSYSSMNGSDLSTKPNWIRTRYLSWLERRVKRKESWVLDQRSIFIVPSKQGFILLGLVLLIIILAINYQNNLLFALAFWLFSILVITIVHSYLNIAGLRLSAGHAAPVFLGETAYFEMELAAGERGRADLKIGSLFEEPVRLDLASGEDQSIALPFQTHKRGWLEPERVRLESFAPIGWVRAWSWLALDRRCLVYPKPFAVSLSALSLSGEGEAINLSRDPDPDDFSGFHSYSEGESLRHANWRSYARGQDLSIKEFGKSEGAERWLNWEDFTHLGCERCLGALCSLVLQLENAQLSYGLKLPSSQLPISRGDNHRRACLTALALAESW